MSDDIYYQITVSEMDGVFTGYYTNSTCSENSLLTSTTVVPSCNAGNLTSDVSLQIAFNALLFNSNQESSVSGSTTENIVSSIMTTMNSGTNTS